MILIDDKFYSMIGILKIRSIRVIRGQKNIFCAFCDFRVTSILHFSLFTSRSDH